MQGSGFDVLGADDWRRRNRSKRMRDLSIVGALGGIAASLFFETDSHVVASIVGAGVGGGIGAAAGYFWDPKVFLRMPDGTVKELPESQLPQGVEQAP